MSPRVFCEQVFAIRPGGRRRIWLEELVHRLWLARDQVECRICRIKSQVDSANILYLQLRDLKPRGASSPNRTEEIRLFEEFCEACRSVTQAVSEFPYEARIV
jgi:hypothetical protein